MEYTEENVRLAYQRHPATYPSQHRIWKLRGKIPDKYFHDDQLVRPTVRYQSAIERTRQQRLRQILKSEKVSTSAIWQLSKLPQHTWMRSGFLAGKVQLTEPERIQLQTAVQHFRTFISNTLQLPPGTKRNKAMLELARDPRLVKRCAFGKVLGAVITNTTFYRGIDSFKEWHFQQLQDCLSMVLMETAPL
mgnify:CR=1 FL=1